MVTELLIIGGGQPTKPVTVKITKNDKKIFIDFLLLRLAIALSAQAGLA